MRVKRDSLWRAAAGRLTTALGALALTVCFVLLLPVLKSISETPVEDLVVSGDFGREEPPPPKQEETKQEEEKPPEKPPELAPEPAPPLDLAALESALSPDAGSGDGYGTVESLGKLTAAAASAALDPDALAATAEFDQKPRATHQPQPVRTAEMKRKGRGRVFVKFIVDEAGRVQNPLVDSSSDPVFEKAALAAVKQWKFEPGRRGGKPARFPMRQAITFPEGG